MTRAVVALAAALLAHPAAAQPQGVEGEPALCRAQAHASALLLTIVGLRDRAGNLRVELYPDHDPVFLSDSNKLIETGQTFRRITFPVPAGPGPTLACLGVPAPGRYSLVIIHDRDGKRKFNAMHDGIGFPGDPKLGYSQPPASKAWVTVGPGVNRLRITLQYLHGFLQVGPVHHPVDLPEEDR